MKIVVLDGHTENPGDLSWSGLEDLGDLKVYDRTPMDEDEIIRRIGDCEAVYTNKTPITENIIKSCPKMKFVGVLATGYNIIDTDAARRYGVTVCNIPTYGTDAVAQYTFALILEVCHHVGAHSDSVHSGKWARSVDFCYWDYPLIELKGKTLGIIGTGRIGMAVAKIAAAFGMNVIAYSRTQRENSDGVKYVPLDTLFEKSHIISLHCPLTPETEGIISGDNIEKMKDGVIIINTGRGQLIDENALASALKSGKVYAAAVDVVSKEPIEETNPLLLAPNCIITPHIAWASKESRQRLMDIAVDNLRQYIAGRPQNVVS